MAELYVNVNGTWKTASNYYINVNGTWKEGSELHAKVSSAWKQSSSSSSSSSSGPDVDDVFDAYLYTGNGLATSSNRAINVGINLATDGGLVWIKNRSQTSNHVLQDTARGAGSTKRIASNDDDYENQGVNASTGGHISSFTSTGFELNNGSATTNLEVNNNNDNYVAWVFKKTAGFFDIQTYTGNGSNRTISHSLGSVPGAIWIKNRSEAGNWICYHRQTSSSNAEDFYLILNSKTNKTDDDTIFNDTAPTSSVFSLGSSNDVNKSGATYVAYIFAHNDARFGGNGDEAIIQCGSYTGSSAPNTVTIGWEPQWILFKNTVNTNMNWRMYDAARGIPVGNDPRLMPNSTNAEDSNYDKIDITSTGFILDLDNNDMNQNGVLHTYIAIRKETSDAYGGTSGIVTTNIVLDLNASNTSSYGGSGTTWSDISGNNNDLTLTNGPTFTTRDGGAIVFDGTNDYAVSALNQAFFQFGTGDYSYGAWVKVDAQGTTGFESVLSSGPSSSNGSWQLDQYYSNKFRHYLKDGSGGNNEISTTTLNNYTSDWFYLFVVNDRSEDELKFYVNGTLNATGSSANYGSTDVGNFSSAGSTAKNAFNVANGRDQNRYMDGTIAQVHVYKGKALSATEVLQNYNATKGNFLGNVITTNLVLHLDAGKSMSYPGSGTTWTDISGNSNNFTLTNSPTFSSDFGGIITLDGTNDYAISATDAAFMDFGTGDYSFGVWLRQSSFGTGEAVISSEADNGTNTDGSWVLDNLNGYNFFTNTSGNYYRHSIRGSSSSVTQTTGRTAKAVDTWYYVVWVADRTANTGKLYVNGVLDITESSYTSVDVDNKYLRIGGGNTHGSLDADVGQVHIYKGKALSASEVLSNYNATKDTYGYATVSDPSGIIATGLDILLDAGNSSSYSGSGTTWTNIAPSSSVFGDATLRTDTNVNTYSSNNGGYFSKPRAYMVNAYDTGTGAGAAYKTMTYSVWCYITNISGYQSLIDQGNDMWLLTTVPSGGNDLLMVYNPSFSYNLNSPSTSGAAINKWYNFTMTHTEGDVVKMYINGLKVYTSSGTTSSGNGFTNWSFGAGSLSSSNAGNEGWAGHIATIAIYNRALSATEVLQNHNALKSRFGL